MKMHIANMIFDYKVNQHELTDFSKKFVD